MAKLNRSVDDDFLGEMAAALEITDPIKIDEEAWVLLNWAVQESKKGRVILSANPEGQAVERLAMGSLDRVRAKTPTPQAG